MLVIQATAAEVNYRNPTRDYGYVKGSWNIYYEKSMGTGNPKLTREVLKKINNLLIEIEEKLPVHTLNKLQSLNIFLLWGEKSPNGGKKSGMRFVRRGETRKRFHYDDKWEHSLVIYSAENLMYLTNMWGKKAIFHEFSHAWHILNWPEKLKDITKPWKNAEKLNLYTNVEDYKGRIKQKAYARKNHLEYFAELSAMYFVGGDYYPYNKRNLKQYDPTGVKMVEKLWKVK